MWAEMRQATAPLSEYAEEILDQLRSRLGDSLVSVVLFGSHARGEAGEGSDLDILVVSQLFKGSLGSRFVLFDQIEKVLLSSDARKRLRDMGLGTLISPVPLTREEVERNPPILLDVLTDGIVLYDRDDFIRNHLLKLQAKLQELGARKVYLASGKWYWDLKPDYRLGEDVDI